MRLRSGAATDPSESRLRSQCPSRQQQTAESSTNNSAPRLLSKICTAKKSTKSAVTKTSTKNKISKALPKGRSLVKNRVNICPLPKASMSHASIKETITIPNELWLNIFEHLDYFDLKKVAKVSRQFKAFTEHASFDRILYRNRPLCKDAASKMTFHPIIYNFCRCKGTNLTHEHLAGVEVKMDAIAKRFEPGKLEYITDPAIPALTVRHHPKRYASEKIAYLSKVEGITVHDFLRMAQQHMKKTTPASPQTGEVHGWDIKLEDVQRDPMLNMMPRESTDVKSSNRLESTHQFSLRLYVEASTE